VLQNVGTLPQHCTMSQLRRTRLDSSPMWRLQFSANKWFTYACYFNSYTVNTWRSFVELSLTLLFVKCLSGLIFLWLMMTSHGFDLPCCNNPMTNHSPHSMPCHVWIHKLSLTFAYPSSVNVTFHCVFLESSTTYRYPDNNVLLLWMKHCQCHRYWLSWSEE
jgi:hypothetical protein